MARATGSSAVEAGMPAAAAPAKPASGARRWLQGAAFGGLVTLATPTALLGGLLLAPSLMAALIDQTPGRPASRPMLLWGIAASVRPMVELWTGGHTNAHALALASDLSVIAAAWAAQGGGWLVAEILPLFIGAAMHAAAAAHALQLRQARRRHETEWDLPPRAEEED
jgi:hypothetical protein